MPLRIDHTAWWNLPGVVAAYQPVAAPGSLLARYNMREGGTNQFGAVASGAPTFHQVTGWYFPASAYFQTSVTPNQDYTLIYRYSNATRSDEGVGSNATGNRFYILPNYSGVGNKPLWGYGANITNPLSEQTSGVLSLVGPKSFFNGTYLTQFSAQTFTTTNSISIGHLVGMPNGSMNVQAVLIAQRVLSNAEDWSVSRQMQYCDVNPEWSVWGRRRRWYYGPGVASGFQAAWASNANSVLKVIGR